MEYSFKLSAEAILGYVSNLRKTGGLPPAAVVALAFIDRLKGKKLEITIRAVDEKEEP